MSDASWMGEGHYAAVEIDDASGLVSCDPKPRPDSVYLVNVIHVVGEIGAIELICFAYSKLKDRLTVCLTCSLVATIARWSRIK